MIKPGAKKILYIFIICALLGIGTTFLLAEKYGFLDDGNKGYIEITSFQDGSKVFIDNEVKKVSIGNPTVSVTAGIRDVLVSKEGYWPWFKQVTVDQARVTEISPFLVEKSPEMELIDETDSEYGKLIELTKTNVPPIKENQIISENGKTSIWIQDNSIFVKWLSDPNLPHFFCKEVCRDTISIFKSETPIRSINFFSGRHDVIMMAVGKGIYAVEIDTSSIQNFEPVYVGVAPYFFIAEDKSIYISDENSLRRLIIK